MLILCEIKRKIMGLFSFICQHYITSDIHFVLYVNFTIKPHKQIVLDSVLNSDIYSVLNYKILIPKLLIAKRKLVF